MLETAIHAAREAGKLLLEGSRRKIRVERLARRDVKLAMDKEAEKVILCVIRKKFPGHAILSEESGAIGPAVKRCAYCGAGPAVKRSAYCGVGPKVARGSGHRAGGPARRSDLREGVSDYLWVIDPLDGTFNYSRRIPLWGISVALLHQGREIVGVIFDPLHGELFHAEAGKGAFMNGKRIHVSERSPLSAAIIAFGFSSNEERLRQGLRVAAELPRAAGKVRGLGSAVLHLAYVACGRLDGFFEFGINQWDIAAGVLLIREAGGQVAARTLPDGSIDLVCSNGLIQRELLKQVGW
jgi:myo-inositol-1(or 4)-monophosphatase